ncbi:MAG: hypothetical protein ACRETL_11840, partial [Gammaproteobacteria bacterium]
KPMATSESIEPPKISPVAPANAAASAPAYPGVRRGPAAIGLTAQEKALFDRERQQLVESIDVWKSDPRFDTIKKFKEGEIADLDNLEGPFDLGDVKIATGAPIPFFLPAGDKLTMTFTNAKAKSDRGKFLLHAVADTTHPDGSLLNQTDEIIVTPGTPYGLILNHKLFRFTPQ